jgi:outer membrane protein assembly factor BamB
MKKSTCLACALLLTAFALNVSAADWPDWRGPLRDGISIEKNLPEKWSLTGENLAWKLPYGGRSTPIVIGDRVCVQNSVGKGASQQERVMCLNVDTGKVLWEFRFNVYSTDVPTHRVAWASPVADPATGNIYVIGAHAQIFALDKNGKLIWTRQMTEEMGAITTHGGRTVSPIIDGDLMIVSFVSFAWGQASNGAYRILAFDKKSGEIQWVASPGGRPTDTVYSSPIVAIVDGLRQFIIGGSDGGGHALMPQDGQWIWSYPMAKRGINTNFVVRGNLVYGSHSEENFTTNEMGLLVAIDGSQKGNIAKPAWSVVGFQGGFSSPVVVGDVYYQVDNSAVLYAFDANNGKELWKKALGTVQKASLVYGDGKLYVGAESGKFWILRPSREKCEVLSEVDLQAGHPTATAPASGEGEGGRVELTDGEVLASVAISGGRVFMVSTDMFYAIGKTGSKDRTPAPSIPAPAAGKGDPAYMIVTPTEVILKPGGSIQLHAKLFDAAGGFLREEKAATWGVNQAGPPPPPPAAGAPPAPPMPPQRLPGAVVDGNYTVPGDAKLSAGEVRAAVGKLTAVSRIRVIPPPPYSEDFDSATLGQAGVPAAWVNATGKYEVREVNGSKSLVKLKIELPFRERARTFIGAPDWKNYTIEADVSAIDKGRKMGDTGLIAQGYNMILLGNHQRVELESWSYEGLRTVKAEFKWKPDTWYHMKLESQDLPGGKVRVRGKVWLRGDVEPAAWLVERTDPMGIQEGAAGIYGNALNEVFFDNIKITANK